MKLLNKFKQKWPHMKARIKRQFYQTIIAIDQLFNTFVCWGWADETFSARCWRLRHRKFWLITGWLVDLVFFWDNQTVDGRKMRHCEWAYENEMNNIHKPRSYRHGRCS